MSERDVNPAADRVEETYQAAPVVRDEHGEAQLTRLIEQQTARIPSHWFLAAAITSMVASLGFELVGRTRLSRFVGMWVPTLLITGVYNKLVKALGPQ
jgi:hypothetical protein